MKLLTGAKIPATITGPEHGIPAMNIVELVGKYETWLREQLNSDVFEDDVDDKHQKMADGAFQFLRATYWHWAETIYATCPDLKDGPEVLAVGDIHIENFGTWRDEEGRLVWGVNDFDETAYMPYAIDLVRLATSAMLATEMGLSITPREICDSILEGYAGGIESDTPKPFVLDREHEDMRGVFVVNDGEREDFWKKFDPANIAEAFEKAGAKDKRPKIRPVAEPPERHERVLRRARPDSTVALDYFERTAGTGSLGRPRYVGIGEWRGDLIVRETKAIVPSGWVLVHGGSHRLLCEEIAWGRNRAPDPSYRLRGHVLVRRLSPNDFKIEVKEAKKKDGNKKGKKNAQAAGAPDAEQDAHKAVDPNTLVNAARLRDMGSDLASIHRGTRGRRREIAADLKRRGAKWLLAAATAAQEQVEKDWGEWRKVYDKSASAGSKKTKKTKKKSKRATKKKSKKAKKGK